jgi:hypothetical protein
MKGGRVGLAISDKKLFHRRRNNWFVPAEFWLFRETENSPNYVPNRSAWNKIRCKRSEICSEPFRERENNSEFRSVEQKIEANTWNSVPNHSAEETTTQNFIPKHVSEENMLSILFDGAGVFVKLIFFMPFPPFRASE